MTKAIVPVQTFEEKMRDKIRSSIGDLIGDEDLSKLINKSLEEVFFKPRVNPRYSSYGHCNNEPRELPPFLHELVKDLMKPAMEKAITEYLLNNKEQVAAMVQSVITNGAGSAMLSAITNQFQTPLMNFQFSVNEVLNRLQQPR